MASQAFITKKRLRAFDKTLGEVIENEEGVAVEQAVIVKTLLEKRKFLGDMVSVTIPNPERVVEGLVSLVGDEKI